MQSLSSSASFSSPSGSLFSARLGKILAGLGLCFSVLAYLALGPDQELHFERSVPSALSVEHLDRQIRSVTRWPQWFFTLDRVEPLSAKSEAETPFLVEKGQKWVLQMDAHRPLKKPFQLTVEVQDFVPLHHLRLKLLDDSSGKLTRLFDVLEWDVELLPAAGGPGSVLVGRARAHTHHWKARLFGRLVERILMNQVVYFDLMKLSELRHPFTVMEGVQVPTGFGS
jgi:hypothetical protein